MMREHFEFQNWITDGNGHPFYARKTFKLEKKPAKAIAFVCGLGQFNFYVNGQKVSDHVLDPAWTDYRKIVYYLKFDITEYLQTGTNVLACEVGNGWYMADQEGGYFFHFPTFMPPNPNPYKPFDKALVLGVHVEFFYTEASMDSHSQVQAPHVSAENNSKETASAPSENTASPDLTIDTDTSWKVAPHPILHSNCFGSEVMDGRKVIPEWKEIDPDDRTQPNSIWQPAQIAASGIALNEILAESKMPPVRVIHTYEAKYLGQVNGRSIYDFGQNCSGMLSFEVRGAASQTVHAYPAEKLTADGDVDQMAKNWLPIDVTETYTIGQTDVWETYAMTFTYFGGRYVAIDVDPSCTRNIQLHAISSAEKRAGTFECDDERYMQIYDLIEKAVEANMVGVHTDCPTIERFAWQEENHLMAPTIMYMKDVKAHWEKFLKDTRLSQLTADNWFWDMDHNKYYPGDGLIPSQAPCYLPNVLPVPGMGDFYNVIGWGSSIILGTYWHYMFYGDVQIIRDNYEAGKKYLEFLKTMVNEDGFINNGLGDWGNPDQNYAKENVETAFLYADTTVLEKFAGLLGNDADAAAFTAYAEEIKRNYNDKLLVKNPDTGLYCYQVWGKEPLQMTQASEAMPLFWGMVPEDKISDVVESFRRLLIADGSLKTGEVGQPYIVQTMNRYGMNDLLSQMILKPEHPSYYAFVLAGETTLGEYWEENPRSHCHDMMGHIAEWYYNGIAGIQPLEPGFKKVLIRPWLPESMHHVKATYDSAAGRITVEMTRQEDGRVALDVEAADGIEVTINKSRL